eukprot:g8598.t1
MYVDNDDDEAHEMENGDAGAGGAGDLHGGGGKTDGLGDEFEKRLFLDDSFMHLHQQEPMRHHGGAKHPRQDLDEIQRRDEGTFEGSSKFRVCTEGLQVGKTLVVKAEAMRDVFRWRLENEPVVHFGDPLARVVKVLEDENTTTGVGGRSGSGSGGTSQQLRIYDPRTHTVERLDRNIYEKRCDSVLQIAVHEDARTGETPAGEKPYAYNERPPWKFVVEPEQRDSSESSKLLGSTFCALRVHITALRPRSKELRRARRRPQTKEVPFTATSSRHAAVLGQIKWGEALAIPSRR